MKKKARTCFYKKWEHKIEGFEVHRRGSSTSSSTRSLFFQQRSFFSDLKEFQTKPTRSIKVNNQSPNLVVANILIYYYQGLIGPSRSYMGYIKVAHLCMYDGTRWILGIIRGCHTSNNLYRAEKIKITHGCTLTDLFQSTQPFRCATPYRLNAVLGNTWLRSIGKFLHNFEDMIVEFKLDGQKRRWVAVVTKQAQSCEANMIEKLYKGGAHYFAVFFQK